MVRLADCGFNRGGVQPEGQVHTVESGFERGRQTVATTQFREGSFPSAELPARGYEYRCLAVGRLAPENATEHRQQLQSQRPCDYSSKHPRRTAENPTTCPASCAPKRRSVISVDRDGQKSGYPGIRRLLPR